MSHLSTDDYRTILGSVHDLHRAADLNEFGQAALVAVTRVVACDHAAYNELDPAWPRAASFFDRPDMNRRMAPLVDTFARLMHQHPILQHFLATPGAIIAKFSDLVTPDELHALEIYHEIYKPLDTEHQMVVRIPGANPLQIGVALNRQAADFSERDREALATLHPHLMQAYRAARVRHRLRALVDADATEFMLEDLGQLGLTPRESHVLLWAIQGLTTELIARQLKARPATIKTHLERILKKLGAANRQGATIVVLRHMLDASITPPTAT